jgi:trimeric autotransporter adhesin
MNTTNTLALGGMFRRGLAVVMFALFSMLFMLGGTAHAAPAAGTVIGNQATATYKDASNVDRTATSNLVQTTVSQVKSFTLDQNNTKDASPGQPVYFPHTITNTGNGTDTITLQAATAGGAVTLTGLTYYADANGDGLPDSLTPITSTGALLPGQQFKFVVGGVVPAAAVLNSTGTVTVNALDSAGSTSTNNPTATPVGTNLDTVKVTTEAVNVTKSMTVDVAPVSPVTLTVKLSYTNAGTAAATNLLISDALPAGLTYVANSGRWSVSGATALTDAALGDPAGIAYDFTAGTVTATVASVGAGISGDLSFKVTVNAGLTPQTLNNTATYKTTENPAVKNSNTATYVVGQVASVVANGSVGSNVNGAGEPVSFVPAAPLTPASQGSTITFTDYVWNTGTGTDSFDITLSPSATNPFPAGTTFQLLRPDGSSLIDTNGNGIPDTGPLAPGASVAVLVRAILPPTATTGTGTGGLGFQEILTVTSKLDPTKTDTVIDTLAQITALTLDLTNNTARTDSTPAGTAALGNAATTGFGADSGSVILTNSVTPLPTGTTATTFKLVVNNTSAVADSYNLSTIAGLPAGWTVTFKADGGTGTCSTTGATITNTGSVATGGNSTVCAVVTVPAISSGQAPAGPVNLTFKAQSATNPLTADTIIDQVAVQPVASVTLTPNGTQQTFPGGAVTYTHTLTNTGNASAIVTFPALTDTQAGFTSAVYLDLNNNGIVDATDTLLNSDPAAAIPGSVTVPANGTAQILVRVFAPGSATSATASDVTTITGTVTVGASVTTITATDTTSVTDGLLLEKTQQTVGCAAAPVVGAYTSAPIAASAATAPGQCIAYQVKATNTTAGVITNLNISDIVPANTSLQTTCGAPSLAGTPVANAAYVNGFTGTVSSGTIASLASTASTTLTFCVRINP